MSVPQPTAGAAEPAHRQVRGFLPGWRARISGSASGRTPKPKRNLTATLREWHKRIGLAACLFLIWLAVSGVLLTRSVELGFDASRVDWDWLMALYGLHAEPPQNGFTSGGHWLAATSEFTVLDGNALPTTIVQPLGFVAGGASDYPLLFVAAANSVVLLSPDGQRIDELRAPILPIPSVRRIGTLKSDSAVVAIQDFDAYQSPDSGESWQPVTAAEVNWSVAVPLPEEQREKVKIHARPRVIIEQVLIDIHSGRLFGPIGAWIITIIGVLAIWIASSGAWMWWRVGRAKRRREQAAR